jgi:D-sedoheptulose 7-phosphate isomerase
MDMDQSSRGSVGASPEALERMRARVRESCEVKASFSDALYGRIHRCAVEMADALAGGGKVLLMGNGGSAADAQHIAAELVGRFQKERRALPALALTVNSSAVTAIANDYALDAVFARQVEAFAGPGDMVIGISTSGRSPNVLAGMEAARRQGARVVGFTGEGGGQAATLADILIDVPSRSTPRIQEAHITIGHLICEMVEERLFGG